MDGELKFGSNKLPLGRFFPRAVRLKRSGRFYQGVRVNTPNKGKYLAPGVFMVRKPGGVLLLSRVGDKRLPLRKRFGPSLSESMLLSQGLLDGLVQYGADRFNREAISAAKFLRDRAVRRAAGK